MRSLVLSFLFIASLAITEAHCGNPCGPGLSSCKASRCCSAAGKCGIGVEFCGSGCQSAYGRCRHPKSTPPPPPPPPVPGPPPPPPTTGGGRPPRPQDGAPATVITKCTVPGTVAITFDDGPSVHTSALLDILAKYSDVRVTFFVNGNNYVDASLPEYQAVFARAYHAGHQIASHTFQHKDLATVDASGVDDQMLKNDDVIYSAIGQVPRYMRPPYGSTNTVALTELGRLGFVVINWSTDTRDWATDNADTSATAYQTSLTSDPSGMFIALEHDTVPSTTMALMDKVIPMLRAHNLRMVTVAECLGDSRPYL